MTGFVWAGFVLLVLLILAFDLGIFSRETKSLTAKAALFRTGIYFMLAVAFTGFVFVAYDNHWFDLGVIPEGVANAAELPDTGWEAAVQFFMGYILEQSLSVDNIFVIALILGYFKVPEAYQHRVLLWGILGALVMRGVMIAAGVALIKYFEFMTYVFGAFLIYTAAKMFFAGEDDEIDFNKSFLVRCIQKIFRLHPDFVGQHFFTRIEGKLFMTPLFLTVMVVEATDLLFAVDSIPAVIALTRDPFLVFTSNVFAILGLRSLYFALADLLGRFHLLKYSLVIILGFVGFKMLLEKAVIPHDPTTKAIVNVVSFAVIIVSLLGGVIASFVYPEKHDEESKEPTPEPVSP